MRHYKPAQEVCRTCLEPLAVCKTGQLVHRDGHKHDHAPLPGIIECMDCQNVNCKCQPVPMCPDMEPNL